MIRYLNKIACIVTIQSIVLLILNLTINHLPRIAMEQKKKKSRAKKFRLVALEGTGVLDRRVTIIENATLEPV